jgi:lactate racemase
MIVPLRYAGSSYGLELPEKNLDGIIEPSKPETVDYNQLIENNKLPDEILSGGFRILVVINDSFRSTPSHLILNNVLPKLDKNNDVRIIISTGLHCKPTDDEKKILVGEHYGRFSEAIFWSDSHDFGSFRLTGKWSDGGEVYLHELFFWAEKVIVIGSVEPHYFAGFTGGIKSLVPGLCYYKTIEHNHQKAINQNSQPGVTAGNPVWESLWETVDLLDDNKIFSYQMVQDSDRNIVALYSGELKESYHKAVEFSRSIYIKSIGNRSDLLIAEHSPPLDRNLYQLQKCFENTKQGVVDNGTLLMISGCREGIGTSAFFDLALKYPNSDPLLKQPIEQYNLGIHKLYRTAILTNRINLCLMSFLPDDSVRRVYIKPVTDTNALIKEKLKINPNLKILIVKDAGHTVIKTSENKTEEFENA